MKSTTLSLKSGFLYAGLLLLTVAGLLLFIVAAVAMRPLLIVAGLVALVVGLVLYRLSPGFREWFNAAGEPQISYHGLRLATDIAVYPAHSWARRNRRDVVVGADDLVQSTLGPVDTVNLPAVGRRVRQGERLFSLRRGDRSVDVRAPMSGTVVATNEALLDHPDLVNCDPFNRGWAVRIRADRRRQEKPGLLRGKQARGWFRQEIDRLLATVLAEDAAAPALPDGGALVGELYQHIDDRTWEKLSDTFFAA
jgi:glycine cleavage system H protein